MTEPLRAHQLEGVDYLVANPKGYLAHRPGLGKTRTLLTALRHAGATRPLVVCPAIVQTHWWREWEALGGVFGEPIPIVKSYDAITRGGNALMRDLLLVEGVDALVLDEAHYLKHATSLRTKQLLGRDGYARRLDIVWPASGTPIPRNPAEIWTVLSSLRPDVALAHGLKTYDQFTRRYCVTRGSYARGVWREKVVGLNDANEPELRALLASIMHVREPGADMPAIDWQLLRLDGGEFDLAENPEAYSPIVRAASGWDGTTLEEIANDPHVSRMRRRLGELKAPLAVEMLAEQLTADPAMKVAVFAYHRSVLGILHRGLAKFGVSYIDGDTRDRDLEIAEFQFNEEVRVFLGQNLACSTGMDGLQRATNRVVLVEPEWSADVNVQLGHRVARMGACAPYAIVQMVALAGTLDEAIVAQNRRETEMVASAMRS